MAVFKDKRFTATANWLGGERSLVGGFGLPEVDVATPPELGGQDAGVWSPEQLLLAACASCYELTVVGVARTRGVPLHAVEVGVAGHVTRRDDGRLGFIVIELEVEVVTDSEFVEHAQVVALRAKEACIVTLALDVPVHLRVSVRALEPEEVTAALARK
jgi:organic hydroperoxide reductase OsmC/OhrA